jgi:hypothetical protein
MEEDKQIKSRPFVKLSGSGKEAVTFDEEGKIVSIEAAGISDSLARLSNANPSDVQTIAASQLELMVAYHQIALAQSRRSFFWALIGSGLGLVFFMAAVAFALVRGITLASIVPLISGAVVEIVAGVVFYMYGQTTSQLGSFYDKLEVLQRYLLANSLCETLTGTERSKARAGLIQAISQSAATPAQKIPRQSQNAQRTSRGRSKGGATS